jgi:hypothetical protein
MDFVGLNAVDDETANIRKKTDNGTLAAGDVGMAAINIGLASTRGEEGSPINEGKAPLEKAPRSPNVEKALQKLDEIKSAGGTVRMNPTNPTQEFNMTIQYGTKKLDVRIETHPLPETYGGDGSTPVRHMNVDLYPKKSNPLPNKGHKILHGQ